MFSYFILSTPETKSSSMVKNKKSGTNNQGAESPNAVDSEASGEISMSPWKRGPVLDLAFLRGITRAYKEYEESRWPKLRVLSGHQLYYISLQRNRRFLVLC